MKFIKLIKSGLYNLAKITHLKPNQLYVILGLVLVVLLALALGTKVLGTKREGFESTANANRALPKIVDDMNYAISKGSWTSNNEKNSFTTNINFWFQQKMLYLVQGGVDLKTYDTNKNDKIYELNPVLQGSLDASGNAVPKYIDDNITPSTNFLKQYTLIDIKNDMTQAELNVFQTQITNKINSFLTSDPIGRKRLQDAFNALSTYATNLGKFLVDNPKATGAPSFANILSQGISSGGGGGYGRGRNSIDVSYNSTGGWVNGVWTDIVDNGSKWGNYRSRWDMYGGG